MKMHENKSGRSHVKQFRGSRVMDHEYSAKNLGKTDLQVSERVTNPAPERFIRSEFFSGRQVAVNIRSFAVGWKKGKKNQSRFLYCYFRFDFSRKFRDLRSLFRYTKKMGVDIAREHLIKDPKSQ